MNKKLFRRNSLQAQLEHLYRDAEQGADLRDVDPEVQREFAADQWVRRQLGGLTSQRAPANPEIGRASLLAAVARQRSDSLQEERRTMTGRLLGAKGLALLAVAGIFAGGAATVGASGGVSKAAGNANDVLATLHVPHKAHGHGHGNSGNDNEQRGAGTPAAEGTQRAIQGIPADNPQHHPADADGACDKGETIVKTTPSGVAVNVPCQTGEDHGQGKGDKTPDADETPGADRGEGSGHGNGQGKGDKTRGVGETPDADETPEADETPDADETEPIERPGEDADHTPVPHSTQANGRATDGSGNAPGD